MGTIQKTILGMGNPLDDVDAFLTSMEAYAKMGIDLVEIVPRTPDPVALVTQLGETVIPRLAELG